MAFVLVQARCNANVLRRFGVLVQLNGAPVQGDFTAAQKERDVAGMPVSALDPMCTVLDAAVPANPVGKSLVYAGITYTVREVKADGLGMTVLTLGTV